MNLPARSTHQIAIRCPSARIAWIAILIIAIAILGLSIFYLAHSYNYLSQWYLSLNPDMPHKAIWQTRFFNPGTKAVGNIFCWIGSGVSLLLIIISLYAIKKPRKSCYYFVSRLDLLILLFFAVTAICLWFWGQSMAEIGADEMYSAYYCAGIHPFQTLSYYMDPNNHILFNLLNRILFFGVSDKLLTGRVISLFAFVGLTTMLYFWIKEITTSAFISLLITLAITAQFQVLGFAQLARGYELYLLFHWMAFIAFFRYLKTQNTNHLIWFALANAAGFLTIPTYLYFFVAISIVGFIYQCYTRKYDFNFWKYAILSGLLTLLVYLPAILFSGLHAITSNDFVAARSGVDLSYLLIKFQAVIQEVFWINYPAKELIYGILFVIPIPIIFYCQDKAKNMLWISYLLVWPVYFIIAIYMKHFASMRNIIWQEQFTLLCVLLALYSGLKWVSVRIKIPAFSKIAFPALLLSLTVHFLIFFPWQIDFALYGISTHKHNEEVSQTIKSFPANAVIACPDFAISWYYLAKDVGHKAVVYPTGKEEIFVTHDADNPPGTPIPGYRYWKTQSYYFIYLREDLTLPK